MIRRTFLILPSVGRVTERSLWEQGIRNWDDFLAVEKPKGFSRERKARLDPHLEEADELLQKDQTGYFTKVLPSREHWRMFDRFEEDTAFLDIETDGLSSDATVTVVGVHRNHETRTLVRGRGLNSESLKKTLDGCKLLVTFNGSSFDIPMLEYRFPFAIPNIPHFDLRHTCARIGLKGGLKSIERQLGMARPKEVDYVTGEQAVYLWHLWERKGRENALKLLTRYNAEDTENLKPLARHVYDCMRQKVVDETESV